MRGDYSWIFILVFGWSITGGIASFLISQFGFPITWITPLTLIMLGSVLFLVYRGYSMHGWILAGCIGVILISGVAFARAFTVPDPNIPAAYRAEFEANANSSNALWDYGYYGGYDVDSRIEYDPDRTSYLIWSAASYGYETVTSFTIEFPPFDTAGGQWAFVSGSLRLRGGVGGTFDAIPEYQSRNGDNVTFEPDDQHYAIIPTLVMQAPLPASTRDPIAATATMEIAYPLADGTPETATLTRDFELVIAGADYYTYYDRYQNWQNSRRVIDTPLWIALAVGSVVAAGAGVYVWREGDLTSGASSSGLQMVIRRLSGAQQLGAEVHDLAKFREQTDAEQGVFVGRVVAQSPAGRGGLRTGDVLLELAGKPTNNPGAVNRIAKSIKKGTAVDAVVLRHDARVELKIRF